MASGGFCIHDKKSKPLVVAIKFGTTFSCCAFSWKNDYKKDPCLVHAITWAAGPISLKSVKVPTCVLFDENKNFHSFGYNAEDAYSELALDGEHEKWYFFKQFKMRLHVKRRLRDTELEDDKGRTMPAIKVFAEVIRYLKCQMFKLIKNSSVQITDDEVHFILTVPAIWTDYAKQFMREAASEADIDGGQLSIVLEPEAASLYCQLIPTEKLLGSEDAKFALASPGTKYMVIDLGDGTADITVHERLPDGGLKELYKVSGDVWGGIKVEEEFNKLLVAIIGAPAFQAFCDQNRSDQLDLYRELETNKRKITPHKTGKIIVKVPVSLVSTFDKENQLGESISDAIENSPYKGKVQWNGDKMRIDADIFKAMFKPCCKKVVEHIKDLLTKKEVKGTSLFLMVGGFSECFMIQDAVMKAFPNYKVIIPKEAGLAVLTGAVIFGHRPVCIESKVAKYTYGINISPAFDKSVHPEDHKVTVSGIDRCRDVFKKYIHKGETVQVGEARSGKHVTVKPNQRKMLLKIFASPRHDPKFVDEDDTEYLGKLVINLPDIDQEIEIEVKMMLGETELTVEAQELHDHTKYRAYFNFL